MSVIGPVQSHYHEGSPVVKEVYCGGKNLLKKVGFEPGVKEWWMMRAGMMTKMGWQMDEKNQGTIFGTERPYSILHWLR